MIAALVIFCATYLFLAGTEVPFLELDRPGGALLGAAAMVVFGVLTPEQVYRDAISWDTIVLLLGMMVLSSVMARAGIFRWVGFVALRRAHGPKSLLAAVVVVAGLLSAFLVNDTVCVMCTPMIVAMVEAASLPPLPFLLALAFASNAGSVATLTGNPQNMLIGTLSRIPYAHFTAALALPAILSLACVYLVLRMAFRRDLGAVRRIDVDVPPPQLHRWNAIACAGALAFVVVGFVLGYDLAWTALVGSALLLVVTRGPPREVFAQVDGTLLLFFAGLFVVTHGVAQAGIAERIFRALEPYLGSDAVQQTIRFGGFTVAACQLVSNVPFVLLAGHWVPHFADPHLGWLGLALFSTLAGNLTPVASVANLIVLELGGRHGKVPFFQFLRIGAAATFLPLALGAACLLAERRLGLLPGP
jgi:Na+/H+ antiporter NhaD/arsenite permease-like protein